MDLFQSIEATHIVSGLILLNVRLGIGFVFWSWHKEVAVKTDPTKFQKVISLERWLSAPCWLIQPLSGASLIFLLGHDWTDRWLVLSYGVFSIGAVAWISALSLSRRLCEPMSENTRGDAAPIPDSQHLIRKGLRSNGLSAVAVVALFWLMLAKP